MKNYLIIFFYTITIAGYAQADPRMDLPAGYFIPFIEPNAGDIAGDPYLIDDWQMGAITTQTGTFDSLLLRYNVVADIVEYRRGTHTLSFRSNAVKSFRLFGDSGQRTFEYIAPASVKNISRVGFYEVVTLGTDSIPLLIRHVKNLYKADFGPYSTQRESEYRYEPMLYIKKGGRLAKARLKNKFCQDQFGMSSAAVQRSLEQHGILLND